MKDDSKTTRFWPMQNPSHYWLRAIQKRVIQKPLFVASQPLTNEPKKRTHWWKLKPQRCAWKKEVSVEEGGVRAREEEIERRKSEIWRGVGIEGREEERRESKLIEGAVKTEERKDGLKPLADFLLLILKAYCCDFP